MSSDEPPSPLRMPGLTHLGVTGVAGVIISHIGYTLAIYIPAPHSLTDSEHCTPSGGADSVGMVAQWAHPHHLFLHYDLLTAKAGKVRSRGTIYSYAI